MTDMDAVLKSTDEYLQTIRVVRKAREKAVAELREVERFIGPLTDKQTKKLEKIRAEFADMDVTSERIRAWGGQDLRWVLVEEESI